MLTEILIVILGVLVALIIDAYTGISRMLSGTAATVAA